MEAHTPFERVWTRLAAARDEYRAAVTATYDEVLIEVAERTEARGSLGKADIGALVVWKRLQANTRWVSELMEVPETTVRAVTSEAVRAVRDTSLSRGEAGQKGREALSGLPGFGHGPALASALLTAAAPGRMAVYDRRARRGLERLGVSLGPPRGLYGRYMDLLDRLLEHGGSGRPDWTARDVDTALYWLGGDASA
ncbi:hypothetical protein [Streptomyces specialis]|uniref:hypothetical protein n=1 Tax=Streptomyces specialis TaxID=498367 RepID=UPI000AA3F7DB|nr:hypothetical protein [Streptomyces specialis]